MTVAGQPTVNYSYNNANRLTQITQGTSIATYTYDAAGRRTSLTLPNGVLVEYAYDTASRLTSITYKQNGTTVLGDLTYEYDKNGNRIKTGGSFARTGIPQAVSSTAYDAANEQTTFGGKTLTYDNNPRSRGSDHAMCLVFQPFPPKNGRYRLLAHHFCRQKHVCKLHLLPAA